jgi:hypothetical protein
LADSGNSVPWACPWKIAKKFLIAAARITTEKGAAIDSLYITDLHGERVNSAWQIHELNTALRRVTEHRPVAS